MKIAWFKREINPELGTGVAGYDFSTKSKVIHDNLYMTGLCMDDGENKALIISFDLLALDGWYIRNLQKECAEILNTRPEMILFSCTHNHSGPEAATPLAPNHKGRGGRSSGSNLYKNIQTMIQGGVVLGDIQDYLANQIASQGYDESDVKKSQELVGGLNGSNYHGYASLSNQG